MKMKKLDILIYISIITMFVVWLFVDMLKLVDTPLTVYGMNHWIPEMYVLFFFGYDISDRLKGRTLDFIVSVTFLYPLLYYSITGQRIYEMIFGFGAGCMFSGILLFGVWWGKRQKKKT